MDGLTIILSADIVFLISLRHNIPMNKVTRLELELIRAKVREGMAAAARGELFEVNDTFMEDLFRRAQERAAQRSRDFDV